MRQNGITCVLAAHWDAVTVAAFVGNCPAVTLCVPWKAPPRESDKTLSGMGPHREDTGTITFASPRSSLAAFHLQYEWRRWEWLINSLINNKLLVAIRLQGDSRFQRGVGGGWAVSSPCPLLAGASVSQRRATSTCPHSRDRGHSSPPRRRCWEVLPVTIAPAVQMFLSPGFIRAMALVYVGGYTPGGQELEASMVSHVSLSHAVRKDTWAKDWPMRLGALFWS